MKGPHVKGQISSGCCSFSQFWESFPMPSYDKQRWEGIDSLLHLAIYSNTHTQNIVADQAFWRERIGSVSNHFDIRMGGAWDQTSTSYSMIFHIYTQQISIQIESSRKQTYKQNSAVWAEYKTMCDFSSYLCHTHWQDSLVREVLALSVDTDALKESLWRITVKWKKLPSSPFLEISTHSTLWFTWYLWSHIYTCKRLLLMVAH